MKAIDAFHLLRLNRRLASGMAALLVCGATLPVFVACSWSSGSTDPDPSVGADEAPERAGEPVATPTSPSSNPGATPAPTVVSTTATPALPATASDPACLASRPVTFAGPTILFTFPQSSHSFVVVTECEFDAVTVGTPDRPMGARRTGSNTWEVDVVAPGSGVWQVEATAYIAGSEVARTEPLAVPVVSPPRPDDPPTVLVPVPVAEVPWGTEFGEVGRLVPLEGESREPVSLVYIAASDEVAIVDDVNDQILILDEAGTPVRSLPIVIDGFVADAVMVSDHEMLLGEVVYLEEGGSGAVAHLVDVRDGTSVATAPASIPTRPGGGLLYLDGVTHIVYFMFGSTWYPFVDLAEFELVVDRAPADSWFGRVTDDGRLGIESGPDFLDATFPSTGLAIEQIEPTPSGFVLFASYVTPDDVGDGALVVRLPFDGSPVTMAFPPHHRLWGSSRVFAVRDTDALMMVKAESGLELWSIPLDDE